MAKLFDAKKYKLSTLHIENLESILKIVNLSLRGLECYKVYSPVVVMLVALKEQKSIVEAHLNEQRKIKKNKGATE